jgi:hypothetical protein
MDVIPTGWTMPHLEAWFGYALSVANDDHLNNNRCDLVPGSDASPTYLPTPRGLVTHAHLIVRHLALPSSPTEPRGLMDRAGCLADLRDVLNFFRRALAGQNGKARSKSDGKPPLEKRKPLVFQVYQRIQQERRSKARYRDTVDHLKAEKQFTELVSEAGLKLNTKLVKNALAFFSARRKRYRPRNKQQADQP